MERILVIDSDKQAKREFYETVKAVKFKKKRCRTLEDLRRYKGAVKTTLNDVEYYKFIPYGYDQEYIYVLDHINKKAIRINV